MKLTNAAIDLDFSRWLLPVGHSIVKLDLSKSFVATLSSLIPWHLPNIEQFAMNDCEALTALAEPSRKSTLCKKYDNFENLIK